MRHGSLINTFKGENCCELLWNLVPGHSLQGLGIRGASGFGLTTPLQDLVALSSVQLLTSTALCKKLEFGLGMIYACFLSSLGFGVGGQSKSNFLACTEFGDVVGFLARALRKVFASGA